LSKQTEKFRTDALDVQKRSIQYNFLKREVDTNQAIYENLLQRFKEVDVAGGVGSNNIFIVDTAQLPKSPSYPQRPKILLISVFAGAALGIAIAILIEKLNNIIHLAED
ncbi:MAG: GNVR domain-containing protein, partial [Planktothrix sp.]